MRDCGPESIAARRSPTSILGFLLAAPVEDSPDAEAIVGPLLLNGLERFLTLRWERHPGCPDGVTTCRPSTFFMATTAAT